MTPMFLAVKQLPSEVTGPLGDILGQGLWLVFILCTAGVIVAGARLYSAWRSGGGSELVWLAVPLLAGIVAASASGIAAQLI
ncbi:hypothetical protein [Tomitella gaofuii]|uniref:hypothetical protein n=1 Tax=Tomitella gaofuii TaxID=2760083 RepID=UPI0015FB3A6C|nr:hypothetical protein [Tomitella gaofuii]